MAAEYASKVCRHGIGWTLDTFTHLDIEHLTLTLTSIFTFLFHLIKLIPRQAHALRDMVGKVLVFHARFVQRDACLLFYVQKIIAILTNRALKVVDAALNCLGGGAREVKEGDEEDYYVADYKYYCCYYN